ncbi:MAG: serine/threonine-protein kinase [Dehalococcoidia bacterium]|nr:serine/threonine-protein kinase [Dehalococcoidia bacterium]
MTTSVVSTMIGRFQLQEVLGNTGLSTTYRAMDTTEHKLVALKILSDYFRSEQEAVQRFFEALDRVKGLDHPNILPLLETGRDGQHWWVASEFTTEPNLMQQNGITLAMALSILHGVAQGLDYAWVRGVEHGNLKPTNIFVDAQSHPRIADFGLDVLAQSTHLLIRSTLTTPHPCYTAPEHALGFRSGHAADLYSLACVAYELLTGEVPFYALDASIVLAKQMTGDPQLASLKNPALPKAVDDVFSRALARRPEQRHASASEFVTALETALANTDRALVLPERVDMQITAPTVHRTMPHQQASAEPAAPLTVKICLACGAENVEGTLFCQNCWTRLEDRRGATLQEARAIRRRVVRELRRRRLLLALLSIPVVLLAVAGITYKIIGPNPFLPPPATQLAAVSGPGEWAAARRDALHSAVMPDAPLIQGVTKWTYQTSQPLLSSPAIVGNRVYIATGDYRIAALDRETGKVIWESPTNGPIDSSPAIAGGFLFVGLRDGSVICLDRETGERKWRFQTGNPVIASSAVANGTVYITSGDGKLYAVDAQTGVKRWDFYYGGFLLSAPLVYKDAVIALDSRGKFHVLDAIMGRHRLTFDLHSRLAASATMYGDHIYAAGSNGLVYSFNWTRLQYPLQRLWVTIRQYLVVWKMWPAPAPKQIGFEWSRGFVRRAFSTTPVVIEDTMYIGSRDGKLLALNRTTGETRWDKPFDGTIVSSPVLAGGRLYAIMQTGQLFALDAASGNTIWNMPLGEGAVADLVVAGDTLYVPASNGTLYAIK